MFTDKSEFMAMDREFPNEDYPEGADMDTVPVPAPSTSSGETSSAVQQAKDQTKSMLVKMHTELVKMATKAGITDLWCPRQGGQSGECAVGSYQQGPEVQVL